MKEIEIPKGVKIACGKDFERWYYDEYGVPSHFDTEECTAFNLCNKCKKFNDANALEGEHGK